MRHALSIAAVVLGGGSVAHADEPARPTVIPAKARTLAERGRAYHDAGDYDSAISAFKEAYVMAPSPGLLFNLAQAYRLRGNCDDATLMYRRYLDARPPPDERALAESHLATVEQCVRERQREPQRERPRQGRPQQGSLAGVGDRPRRRARTTTAPGDPAGAHAAPGDTAGAHAPADRRRARPGSVEQDVGAALAIGGGVAVSVAVYYAVQASHAASDIEDAYAMGASWKDLQPIDERGQRSARYAQILGVGGGVATIGGVALYLLGRRAERLAPIAIVPTRRGAEVSLTWQF